MSLRKKCGRRNYYLEIPIPLPVIQLRALLPYFTHNVVTKIIPKAPRIVLKYDQAATVIAAATLVPLSRSAQVHIKSIKKRNNK